MKRKMRKFADGGFSTSEGENKMIDDDVRSRAMKFVEDASEESRDIGAPVTRSAAKSSSKVSQTVSPPKASAPAMPAEEKERMESLVKKQALTPVRPEEIIIGGGGVKALQVAGTKLASKIAADRAAKLAAQTAVKKQARRSEEGFDPSEALEALKPKATKLKTKPKTKTEKMRDQAYSDVGASGMFKSGGSVRSSASRRADGCAVRGKTRA
jgi:hypothetical protein